MEAVNRPPSEGELFKKILGAEWKTLHPDRGGDQPRQNR
jgi:hypothetical protein